ncbi:hypothetical protein SAMN05880592_104101 [Bosea sp. TND4EK4]|nr:hypothetical protein SAMN05880592_104101 [Bosea sp. TND4EK4]
MPAGRQNLDRSHRRRGQPRPERSGREGWRPRRISRLDRRPAQGRGRGGRSCCGAPDRSEALVRGLLAQVIPAPASSAGASGLLGPVAPVFRPSFYGRRAYDRLWRLWPGPSSCSPPLRRRDRNLGGYSVGAMKNGTATLSYRDEFARIPIWAQAPISAENEILLRYDDSHGHFRKETPTQAARFLFCGDDAAAPLRAAQAAPSGRPAWHGPGEYLTLLP